MGGRRSRGEEYFIVSRYSYAPVLPGPPIHITGKSEEAAGEEVSSD